MGRHNASRSSRARRFPQADLPDGSNSSDGSNSFSADFPFELHTELDAESLPFFEPDEEAFESPLIELAAYRDAQRSAARAFVPEIVHEIPPPPASPEITPELTADIMGRISAAELLARHGSDRPASRRSRAGKRALAQRPLWRRSPVIPAVAATIAVWSIGDGLHLVGGQRAGSTTAKMASATADLSALATNNVLSSPVERVSRSKRDSSPFAADLPLPLPLRKGLPPVKIGQTVLGTWIRPSAGGESSCFCMRWGVMHEGIDLAGPLGSPIVAVGDGVVIEAGPAEGFGHWVVIRHSNGDVSIYGHMYTVLVSVGQHVVAGQHIADIGSDGEATGPHLHFGVREGGMNGPYIDPVPWLYARGIDVGTYNPNA